MRLGFDGMKKHCARLAVVLIVGMGTSACSSVPDWVDPTTWIDGPSTPDNQQNAGNQNTDTQQNAANQNADNGQTPDLANLPDKPAGATPDEQKEVADQLAADRSRAHYSSDALRGGTEAAAPPPPSTAGDRVAANQNQNPTPPPDNGGHQQAADNNQAANNQAAGDQSGDNQSADNTPAPPKRVPTQHVAVNNENPVTPPSGNNQPAVPPGPPGGPFMGLQQPTDAQLGFKPSHAAPLDPSVAQFVAPPIIARYQQTAANAGIGTGGGSAVASNNYHAPHLNRGHGGSGVGGPEHMSGAVVANLDALQSPANTQTNVYSNQQGLPPAAVVFFPGDGTLLNAAARAQIRAAVEAYQARGGQGFVRVVGHSSSRTANMPVERHLLVIFEKSQQRANAVAQEVIREGVPASKVLVEAVGDSQPVYYESMPKGEDGNRRAEIFLQS